MKQTVLIIDDEIADVLASSLKECARADDIIFRTATDGGTGLSMAKALSPALILLDIGLPTIDGFTVLSELQKSHVQTRIIMMSGYKTDLTTAINCVKAGACDYIVKGQLQAPGLLERIHRALILETTLNVQMSQLPASAKSLIEEAARLKEDYERLKSENEELQRKLNGEQVRFILATAQKILGVVLASGCMLLLKWVGIPITAAYLIVFLVLLVLLLIPADRIRAISASVQRIFAAKIELEKADDQEP